MDSTQTEKKDIGRKRGCPFISTSHMVASPVGLRVTSMKHFYWKEHFAVLNQPIHDISHRDREFLWYDIMRYASKQKFYCFEKSQFYCQKYKDFNETWRHSWHFLGRVCAYRFKAQQIAIFFTRQHLIFKTPQWFVGQKLTDTNKNTSAEARIGNKFSAFWSRTLLTASIILLVPDPESVEVNKFLSIGYSGIWFRSYSKIEKLNFIFRDYAIKL